MKKHIVAAFVLLCLFILCIPTFSVTNESNIVFSKIPEKSKKIALTFDDGPHPRYTKKILYILNKYNIKATFFVIGCNVKNYPETFKSIFENGHEIGNHSYSHKNQKSLSQQSILSEISECEDIVYNTVGIRPTVFRPPQGDYSDFVKQVAESKDYSIILWSIDTRDWEHNSPHNIAQLIENNVTGGDIILMHDYVSGNNTTCEALELIIPQLLSKGYQFVTVSQIIE